jgi:hypothetical protein
MRKPISSSLREGPLWLQIQTPVSVFHGPLPQAGPTIFLFSAAASPEPIVSHQSGFWGFQLLACSVLRVLYLAYVPASLIRPPPKP